MGRIKVRLQAMANLAAEILNNTETPTPYKKQKECINELFN